MCSMMIALRHPTKFGTFADFGGLIGPRPHDTNDRGDTVAHFFGGSEEQFRAHEPLVLMTTQRYPGLGAWFEVGGNDALPRAAIDRLVPVARNAGIMTCYVQIPNAEHSFDVWRQSFRDALAWIASRQGIGDGTAAAKAGGCGYS